MRDGLFPVIVRESSNDSNDCDGSARKKQQLSMPTAEEDLFGMGPRISEGTDLRSRTGGLYMPPWKVARMAGRTSSKSSEKYQRITWEGLKKALNGLVNKANVSNIKTIVLALFGENLVRGRALFVRSLLKAQMASPAFTPVYAALIAVVNTKMPMVGELLLKRCIHNFRRAFRRNDKVATVALSSFLAHLVNQHVAHEILALQLVTLMLGAPTNDSVEIACAFVTESGATLADLTPKGLNAVFERLRGILHEGLIDKRVQYMIEHLFTKRKVCARGSKLCMQSSSCSVGICPVVVPPSLRVAVRTGAAR